MPHMGSKMSGFLRTLWWIVLFFYLLCVEIWRMKCLEKRCYCKEELQLIDCSWAKLKAIPKSVPLVNYTTLNLRYNLLVQANFSLLEEQLPNLKMVDLRDNPFIVFNLFTFFRVDDITLKNYVFAFNVSFIQNLQHPETFRWCPSSLAYL